MVFLTLLWDQQLVGYNLEIETCFFLFLLDSSDSFENHQKFNSIQIMKREATDKVDSSADPNLINFTSITNCMKFPFRLYHVVLFNQTSLTVKC